ncbi:hypothetical protein AB1Y20_014223 [Prymnesium parvum]|uniref:EF-hand domain-containing protein n=1 Tax=Prymnesium parvum TaxID=97485 RepID=A0AB34IFJ5_PRYPA
MRPLKRLLLLVGLLSLLIAAETAAAPVGGEDGAAADQAEHSLEEMQEAKEEFDSIDTNKDGFVTREEILEMDEVPEADEVQEFFETYDTNSDGKVSFDEIVAADALLREETKQQKSTE